jgi:cysteine desulfurase
MAAYLDYAASNPVWPEAAAAATEGLAIVGNPSATHDHGRRARSLLDGFRSGVAAFLSANPGDLIFTSGATEANNLAIAGLLDPLLEKRGDWKPRAVVSVLEHASVRKPLVEASNRFGLEIDEAEVGPDARLSPDSVRRSMTGDTVMVCLTAANNILGSLQPLAEVGQVIAEERRRRQEAGIGHPLYFLCDAVQAAPWLRLEPEAVGLDALVLSGHKAGGPKGSGVLWLRSGLDLAPLVRGGDQERGYRSGTENLPAIAGMAAALSAAAAMRSSEIERCLKLRRRLIHGLATARPAVRLLGAGEENSLPNIVFCQLPGISGDVMAMKLDAEGFSVSAGSACDSGTRRSPEVVTAVYGQGVGRWGGIRISFGRFTTEAEIDELIGAMRTLSP